MENLEFYNFSTRADYLKALDQTLPEKFVQKRNVASGVYKYYPQAIKEALADKMFHSWHVIEEKYFNIANELCCTVKICYTPDYPGAEEFFCTGSAAIPIQMDAGSKPEAFPEGKKLNSCEYNMPAVRSEAISNALNLIGNIFGRMLSRKLNKNEYIAPNFKLRDYEVKEEK